MKKTPLIRKMLSSLCPAARQYLAAVSVSHSLSKAMLLFSVELLRLIRSQHGKPSFRASYREPESFCKVQPCNLALYRILPLPVNLFLRLHREKSRFFLIFSKYAALWSANGSFIVPFSRFQTQNTGKGARFLSAKHLSKGGECAIISYIMPISAQKSVKGCTGPVERSIGKVVKTYGILY